MKVILEHEKCIGCGNCVFLTNSEIFDFDDDGLAKVVNDDVDKNMADTIYEAIMECPTQAIREDIEFIKDSDNK